MRLVHNKKTARARFDRAVETKKTHCRTQLSTMPVSKLKGAGVDNPLRKSEAHCRKQTDGLRQCGYPKWGISPSEDPFLRVLRSRAVCLFNIRRPHTLYGIQLRLSTRIIKKQSKQTNFFLFCRCARIPTLATRDRTTRRLPEQKPPPA